jgi:hypothetical protein
MGSEVSSPRALELQQRFANVRQAMEELFGRDIAYATCCVGWLEAIEWTVLQALHKVEREAGVHATNAVAEMHSEIKALLKSFHAELCEHLGLDQADIINRSGSFKEVIDDICNRR